MATNFADLIQSHQFTFLVGQEEKVIVVHAAAIAATSQQLDALVNNGMKESEERCAKLGDVQVDDFIRFCEYAYRGDYTAPPWEDILPGPSSTPEKVQENKDDDCVSFVTSSKKKKGKINRMSSWDDPFAATVSVHVPEPTKECKNDDPWTTRNAASRTLLRTQFKSREYQEDGGPKALVLQCFEPKPNNADNQNFAPVFLAHARLFYFAQVRLIAPLKSLTLDKLHKTLIGFKLYSNRIGDIIELTRYAYSNPDLPGNSGEGIMEDLKKLVIEYIVCEIDSIGKCDEFVEYMEEGGEFVGDFWRMARNYMN